jgi:DNA-directed RNA polymerase subunit M/transcription elongation factor TFIIS
MLDVTILTCPSCGGKLETTQDVDRFVCAHCGTEQIVRRDEDAIASASVSLELAEVKAQLDRATSELAAGQLEEEIEALRKEGTDFDGAQGHAIGWCIAGFAGFTGLVIFLLTASPLATTTNLILLAASAITCLGIALISGYVAKEYRKKNRQVDETINKKRAELKHHRKIVSACADEQP